MSRLLTLPDPVPLGPATDWTARIWPCRGRPVAHVVDPAEPVVGEVAHAGEAPDEVAEAARGRHAQVLRGPVVVPPGELQEARGLTDLAGAVDERRHLVV